MIELLTNFIKQRVKSLAGIGVFVFVRLMNNAGSLFSDDKWQQVLLYLKTAAADTVPDCAQIAYSLVDSEPSDSEEEDPIKPNPGVLTAGTVATKEMGDRGVDILQSTISDAKCHTAVQLLLVQVITEMYHMHGEKLSTANTIALLDILYSIAVYAHEVNSDYALRLKLQEMFWMTQMTDPPLLRLENESYQAYLKLLQSVAHGKPILAKEINIESRIIELCEEVLHVYINAASTKSFPEYGGNHSRGAHCVISLGSPRRGELASRAPLVVSTLQAISGLKDAAFGNCLSRFFPLLASLVSCEHGSGEVQLALSNILNSWIGPIFRQA